MLNHHHFIIHDITRQVPPTPGYVSKVTYALPCPGHPVVIQGMSDQHDSLQVGSRPCRMFEDPENAIAVNEGATLIPWMGDTSNMIDR